MSSIYISATSQVERSATYLDLAQAIFVAGVERAVCGHNSAPVKQMRLDAVSRFAAMVAIDKARAVRSTS